MKIFADLHIHSHYSRATSDRMNIENLERYGKVKGVNLIGTGDFTHTLWLKELKNKLKEENGLFKYGDMHFILQAEVSNIYNDGKTRKIHNVILAPSFEVVDQVNDFLKDYGKLASDGRPILTKIDCAEMTEALMKISKDIFIIPAHIWTPWFSLFGSKSGFDRIDDCFKDQTKNIHALETGLSSDPEMNWRLSALDRFTLVSNSDCHSPWPTRLGRELNVLDTKLTYKDVIKTVKDKDPKTFLYTIEVYPSYGKYHWDGHRDHDVVMKPSEAIKNKNICPVCKKELTIGVLHRVEELADREDGYRPKNAIPFKRMIPLSEILAAVFGTQPFAKKVWNEAMKITNAFGNELNVLLEAPEEKLKLVTHEKIVKMIIKNRKGDLKIQPGYDGVYGKLVLDNSSQIKQPQKRLDSFLNKQ